MRKNDFVGMFGVEERADLFAGLFVLFGAALAERVDAAMDVGVVVFVDAANRVDHLSGALCACSIVEKNQRMAVEHVVAEDRKIIT